MIYHLNEITAVIALSLQVLIMKGFLPHVAVRNNRPTTLLARAIFIASVMSTVRLSYYDIWRSFARLVGLVDAPAVALKFQIANACFNFTLIVAGYYALRALHATLPSEDRRQYNWITAPFYPSDCIFIFQRERRTKRREPM